MQNFQHYTQMKMNQTTHQGQPDKLDNNVFENNHKEYSYPAKLS